MSENFISAPEIEGINLKLRLKLFVIEKSIYPNAICLGLLLRSRIRG